MLESIHRGKVVEQLGPGGVFGEISMMVEVPRIVTVRAKEDALLVEVPRLVFERLEQKYPLLRDLLRGFFKDRLVTSVMRGVALFQSFSAEEQKRIAASFELRTAKRGDQMVKPGEVGKGLWVILRGKCVAYDVPTGAIHWELSEGAVFGAMSLLEEQPASAGYRAETDCTLLFFDRESFRREMVNNVQAAEYLRTLARDRLGRIEIAQTALGAALA
jgi:CRP-like cAMP-binding protein